MRPKKKLSASRSEKVGLALSLVRLIEVIGEAANQVTTDFQKEHGEIPWAQIIAMRNRLIHAYFDIDLDRLWDTVKVDLPALLDQLEKILSPSYKSDLSSDEGGSSGNW